MDSVKKNERGVAMMVVVFALLLLSVVGLGMMYSTNMETAINGNYRDKQTAFYAALAGLQEARERIRNQLSTGPLYDITPPTGLPSAIASSSCPFSGAQTVADGTTAVSAGCVIYIVNDATFVKPWDNTTNSDGSYKYYFDTELCQENLVGIPAGMIGVPCPGSSFNTIGSAWYQVYDDHSTSAAPWHMTNPLDWKWTRILLKANNNTPIPVNGKFDGNIYPDQACWNGTTQMSTPYSATTGCRPSGGVTSIYVTNSGGGYDSTGPTVTLTGGDGGSGATIGTLDMQPEMTGYVSAIVLTSAGSGYASAPDVAISGGDGGATAVAILSSSGTTTNTDGVVASVTVTSGGSGYTSFTDGPTVSFSGGGGSGATAVAVMTTDTTVSSGYVSSITLGNAGAGYTTAPTVTINNDGGGTGASATATLGTSGKVVAITLSSPGTQCYSTASDVVVSFVGGTSAGYTAATASAVLETSKSCIHDVTVPSTNCTNQLNSTTYYTHSGSTWSTNSNVTLKNGNNSFAGTFYVRDSDAKTPNSLTIVNPGYDTTNYSTTPFSSVMEYYNNGTGYSSWPKTGSGSHASDEDCNTPSITVTGTGYRIASITITSGGSGYTSNPTVVITGGVGSTSQPTATATVGYPISKLTLGAGGSGYTSAPSVSFSGGQPASCTGCSSASATTAIQYSNTYTYKVASVTVTNGGAGYTSAPTVGFSGGGGSGAAGNANMTYNTSITTYPIDHINVSCSSTSTTTCINYTSTGTTVTISGGGGSGGAGNPTIGSKDKGTYYLNMIPVTSAGSGYESAPLVSISGTGGAKAVAQISGGTKYGNVWMLTSLAQTRTGARSMVQMEVASPVLGYSPGGALTLDGPCSGCYSAPNSGNFTVSGVDANSCGETAEKAHPAIDGYDDPNNPTNPSSVTSILNSIPSNRLVDYIGTGSAPSVQNGYASLGPTMTTPDGLRSLVDNITQTAQNLTAAGVGHVFNSTNQSNASAAGVNLTDSDLSAAGALGNCPSNNVNNSDCHTTITVVQGNLTLGGTGNGYGILLVEGSLELHGTFGWHGPIFVVGDGSFTYKGGGSASVVGNILIANIWNSDGKHYPNDNRLGTLGQPVTSWSGGGNNSITYDHCWTSNLMNLVQGKYYSPDHYKILNTRILPY